MSIADLPAHAAFRILPQLGLRPRSGRSTPSSPFAPFAWRTGVTFLLSLLLLAAASANFARAGGEASSHVVPLEDYANAEIRLTPVSDFWPSGGYMPVRVRIENRAAAARSWTFVFGLDRNWQEKFEFTQALAVGPRSVLDTVVFVPGLGRASGRNATQLRVTVEGPGVERSNLGLTNYNSDLARYVASSRSQEVDLYAAISASPEGGGGGMGGAPSSSSNASMELAVVDAAAWPADWRVWAPFTQVVMTDREFRALDGARRAALMDWVALGGALSLYPPFATAAPSAGTSETTWGSGAVRSVASALSEDKTIQPDDVPAKGFHRQLLEQAITATSPPGAATEAYALSRGSVSITIFLLLFGILIGPVNLLVFAPPQRRHRLFITVPLISLAASVVLALVIIWRDGFGGAGVQRGVVVLLPGENKAAVFQDQLSRTGVLFSDRFPLPADTQLLLPADNPSSGTDNRSKNFARDEGSASGGWFASRQRQAHLLQRITPTRARVELVSGGEAGAPPVVQSSVGAALRDFRYRDRARRLWGADEVAPGQKVTLRSLPAGAPELPPGDFTGRAAASELAPLVTLPAIRWDEPAFFFTGRVEGLSSTP